MYCIQNTNWAIYKFRWGSELYKTHTNYLLTKIYVVDVENDFSHRLRFYSVFFHLTFIERKTYIFILSAYKQHVQQANIKSSLVDTVCLYHTRYTICDVLCVFNDEIIRVNIHIYVYIFNWNIWMNLSVRYK